MEAAAKLVNRPTPPQPAAAIKVSEPVVVQTATPRVQCQSLRVSSPGDAAEVEARQVARSIVSMPATAAARPASIVSPPSLHRATPTPGPAVAPPSRLQRTPPPQSSGGEPLPEAVRQDMESRFQADFSRVRIHRDARAAQASQGLNAAAFTVGNQIHFGAGQFDPNSAAGRELLAHELTHTIQQGAATQVQGTVQRSLAPVVSQAGAGVQRLGIGDALNFFADHANAIPGFRMFTLVLGRNPINMQAVDRSPGNLLRAVVELMPGGVLITRALDNHGIIDRVAGWVQQQIASLGLVASSIRQAVDRFLDSLSWTDIFDLGGVWERAKRIVTEPINRITAFVGNLVSGILQFIRDAVLRPLAGLAAGTRGWDLLCAVLGRNPITGDPVARTADNLIGGFMRLIGQEEIWQNLQRANAINRAFAWFQGALAGVMGFVTGLPQLFLDTLRSLIVADLLTIPQTFARIARVFVNFVGSFISWAGQQVWALLEIIFDVVAPAVMPYLRRAAAAFRTIIANPMRFVGNLVRAGIQGFRQFASNILTHLRAAIIGWLTGSLAGANVYIPQAFTLQEIVKFVLSVLGLTWQNVRTKLVRVVGETAVTAMETGFDIVVTLVRDGPAAAWERIRESLANLREMVMEQVLTFVRDNIVTAAVTRLVSMLNPAGSFIQAIIAIYNTIMFFVERLRQIAQVAAAFIDSIAAIASGVIGAAANRVEQTMAGLLTMVISFLARLMGLGRVSDAITNIINRIRAPIDRALDRVVAWIANVGRRFMGAVRGAAGRILQWWRMRRSFRAGGETHSLYFAGEEDTAELTVASSPRRLDAYVAAARTGRTTPAAVAALGRIDTHITAVRNARTQLRTLRRANRPETEQQPHITAIENALSAIGVELGGLLAGEDAGKRVAPIDIAWPKPAWSTYPPLYLYRGTGGAPWHLTARLDSTRRFVKQYRPTGSHVDGDLSGGQAPAELNQLGIGAEYRIQANALVGPLSEHSTPGGAALNNLLARYGWSASGEDMDGDHVKEIQFGGQDVLANLWPLRASINRGAGSTLSRAPVQLGTEPVTVEILKRVRLSSADQSEGKFSFKIRSVG